MTEITHVVSLGGNCRVTYNLRKYFNFLSAYPFDWWITPLRSVTQFLKDPDLEKLYNPKYLLPLMKAGTIESIKNSHFDILLHHEFPRTNGSVVDNFVEHTDKPKTRQRYLLKKLNSLNDGVNKLLLVRNFLWNERISAPEITEFLTAAKTTFNRAHCQFLFINCPLEFEGDSIINLRFSDPGSDWKGDHQVWTEHLATLAINFSPADGRLYQESSPEIESKLPQ
jgi:hypothetical protein